MTHCVPSMTLRRAARIAAVVGVFAASSFVASVSRANHVISFTECTDADASPAAPTFTPPPVEGEETPPPRPESTPPPQNCMPAEGERIWGARTLRFEVEESGDYTITRATLAILSQEDNIPSANGGKAFVVSPDGEGSSNYSFQWNSREATPYNGIYKVQVTAYSRASRLSSQEHLSRRDRVNLRVDNPPATPAAPKILAAATGSVTLEWQRAPEPDVTAYTVYRATTESKNVRPDYASFKMIGFTTGPAYRDNAVKDGVHWYAVRVTRRSVVTPDQGISSSLSAMSSPAQVGEPTKTPPPKGGKRGSGGGDKLAEPEETRFIPYRQLAPPRPRAVVRAVPDAPFAYKLPYDDEPGEGDFGAVEEGESGPTDPRGPILPVAVGMFLVSSALAVGRMPY